MRELACLKKKKKSQLSYVFEFYSLCDCLVVLQSDIVLRYACFILKHVCANSYAWPMISESTPLHLQVETSYLNTRTGVMCHFCWKLSWTWPLSILSEARWAVVLFTSGNTRTQSISYLISSSAVEELWSILRSSLSIFSSVSGHEWDGRLFLKLCSSQVGELYVYIALILCLSMRQTLATEIWTVSHFWAATVRATLLSLLLQTSDVSQRGSFCMSHRMKSIWDSSLMSMSHEW